MITLKTLADATPQEVFDQVKNHLLNQMQRSAPVSDSDSPTTCKYRYNDLKCAAGCLISDDEYNGEFEHKSWQSLINSKLVLTRKHNQLISELQHIHDFHSIDKWVEKLRKLAEMFNLKYE